MRFRLQPTPAQEQALLEHNTHARFIWNLAVEQHQHWRPGRPSAPGYAERSRQLTEARKEFAWPAAGSPTVQQQALRDFAQPMSNFFAGTHGRPADLLMAPGLRGTEEKRLLRLQRKPARAKWGPIRRQRVKIAIARLKASETDRRKESQAVFRCCVCKHLDHADVNAAKNITAGHAVTARGGRPMGRPVNREPQLVISSP